MSDAYVFADDALRVADRYNRRIYDIIRSIFRLVFDYALPYFAGLYRLSYIFESL